MLGEIICVRNISSMVRMQRGTVLESKVSYRQCRMKGSPATRCQRRTSIIAEKICLMAFDFGGFESQPAKRRSERSTMTARFQALRPHKSCHANKFRKGVRRSKRIRTNPMSNNSFVIEKPVDECRVKPIFGGNKVGSFILQPHYTQPFRWQNIRISIYSPTCEMLGCALQLPGCRCLIVTWRRQLLGSTADRLGNH